MNSNHKENQIKDGGNITLNFPIYNNLPLRLFTIAVELIVLVALVKEVISSDGNIFTGTNLFLITIMLLILSAYWVSMQYVVCIQITDTFVEIVKKNKTKTFDWKDIKRIRYMENMTGGTHFWINYNSGNKNGTVFFVLHRYQSPLETPNRYELLISEFKKKVPTSTFLHIW